MPSGHREMETLIPGIKARHAIITPNCRIVQGILRYRK